MCQWHWWNLTGCLLIVDCPTSIPLASKAKSIDLHISSLWMQMDCKNYPHLWSERPRSHVHSRTRLLCNLVSTTETTWKHGWHLASTKSGFSTGIENSGTKGERFCFFRIIFQVMLFLTHSQTYLLSISNPILLCTSNQTTRESSNASK